MKIYTKTGDKGDTGLFGGPRVMKDSARIEAYGTVDELNAVIGMARTQVESVAPAIEQLLKHIQNDLFDLGSELATPDPRQEKASVTPRHITELEQAIDAFEAGLPPLKEFILPGGSPSAGLLHLARTVCRRAERRVVALAGRSGEYVSVEAIPYLNRLSDLLFVLARAANQAAGIADVTWQKRTP